MDDRTFTGIFIPAKLYLDKDLSWIEKILIVEIEALTNEETPCSASNEHFANHLGISRDRVSKIISNLVKRGYIFSKITCENNSKKRWLLVNKTYSYFQLEGIVENTETPIGENNSLNKVNKNNITSYKVSFDEVKLNLEKMETYKEIVNYMNTVNEHHSFNTKIPFSYKPNSKATQKLINARLREGYNIEEFKDVIWWGYRKFVELEFKTQNGESSYKYFRPSTLFSNEHFEAYLNEYRANTQQ